MVELGNHARQDIGQRWTSESIIRISDDHHICQLVSLLWVLVNLDFASLTALQDSGCSPLRCVFNTDGCTWTTAVRTEFICSCASTSSSNFPISSHTYPRLSKVACLSPGFGGWMFMFCSSVGTRSCHCFAGSSMAATLAKASAAVCLAICAWKTIAVSGFKISSPNRLQQDKVCPGNFAFEYQIAASQTATSVRHSIFKLGSMHLQ